MNHYFSIDERKNLEHFFKNNESSHRELCDNLTRPINHKGHYYVLLKINETSESIDILFPNMLKLARLIQSEHHAYVIVVYHNNEKSSKCFTFLKELMNLFDFDVNQTFLIDGSKCAEKLWKNIHQSIKSLFNTSDLLDFFKYIPLFSQAFPWLYNNQMIPLSQIQCISINTQLLKDSDIKVLDEISRRYGLLNPLFFNVYQTYNIFIDDDPSIIRQKMIQEFPQTWKKLSIEKQFWTLKNIFGSNDSLMDEYYNLDMLIVDIVTFSLNIMNQIYSSSNTQSIINFSKAIEKKFTILNDNYYRDPKNESRFLLMLSSPFDDDNNNTDLLHRRIG